MKGLSMKSKRRKKRLAKNTVSIEKQVIPLTAGAAYIQVFIFLLAY